MHTVLIVVHLMIVIALVVVVLLQKSEGGALGIGGGGGFMAGRSASNPLSRLTAYLAAGFFATSMALTILAGYGGGSVFDRLQPSSATAPQPANAPAGAQPPLGTGQGGILKSLQEQSRGGGAQVPGAPPIPTGEPQFAPPPAQPQQAQQGPTAADPRGDAGPAAQEPAVPQPQGAAPITPQPSDPAAAAGQEPPKQAPAQAQSPEGATQERGPAPGGAPPAATEQPQNEPAKPQP